MRFLRIIFSSLLIIFAIVFIIQNLEVLTQKVQLKLDLHYRTFESTQINLWILILFTFFLGIFTASLYGIYELLRQRRTIRQLRHNLEILGQEIKRGGGGAAPISAGAPPPPAPPPPVPPPGE
jgi:uncharacterized integral membrane protein